MQTFIYCRVTIHVSDVIAPIIRSTKNCNRYLWYRSKYWYSYFLPTWSNQDWCKRVRLAYTSPQQTTLEGSSCTSIMTYTRGSGYSFSAPADGCCDA